MTPTADTVKARLNRQAAARTRAILDAWAALEGQETLPPGQRNPDVVAAARAVVPIGQDPQPCVCGAPRWAHAGKHNTGRVAGGACRRYAVDKVEELAWQAAHAAEQNAVRDFRRWDRAALKADPKLDGQLSVRPSDAGGCERAVWYRNFPPEDYVPAVTDERAAGIGTAIHKGIYEARKALYPWRTIEGWVTIPGLDRRGRYDEWDPLTGILEDGKTVGQRRWERIGQYGPDDSMWASTMIYAMALTREGNDVRTVRIRVINRDNGHEEMYSRPYEEGFAQAALRALTTLASTLDAYRDAVDDGDPDTAEALIPARAGTGPEAFPCGWCPARLHCWNVAEATEAGRSPQSWTILGPSPVDEAVEAQLAAYAAARDAESAAKGQKAEAKDLLDGIPYGRYGEWTYKVTTSPRDNHTAYLELLKDLYPLPDTERPPLENVIMPRRWESRVNVTPVRAAVRQRKATAKARGAADATTTTTSEGTDQ